MKKLYLVKREVYANSIKEALSKKGSVYEVVEAANQPVDQKKVTGFKKDKKNPS